MIGLHRRTRSLIPVKDLDKYEKKTEPVYQEPEEDDYTIAVDVPKVTQKQLTIIYILFLAEAILASCLQPQLRMLIRSEEFCGNLSTSYVRSILDCSYAFGGIAGLGWGRLSDRIGRRPAALTGIYGMACCCFCTGFGTTLAGCASLRVIAGLFSSSIAVTSLTMVGDVGQSQTDRARYVSRLPLIALCGSVGPLVQGMVTSSIEAYGKIWQRYPILSSQIACGSLLLVIGAVETVLLEEARNYLFFSIPDWFSGVAGLAPWLTKSLHHHRSLRVSPVLQFLQFNTSPGLTDASKAASLGSTNLEHEKAAFLGQSVEDDHIPIPMVRVVDSDKAAPIPLRQIICAPSLITLLSSFSLLSMQSSTFDVLLPHLGHSSTHHGGMGIPCSALGVVVFTVRVLAGVAILSVVPRAVERLGLVRSYRLLSLVFPAIYFTTPVFAYLASASAVSTAASSTVAILFKNILAGCAQVLVALLVLNASPDAVNTGTIVGLMHCASLFKALAVGVTGASFYLSSDLSVAITNSALWVSLTILSIIGAALAWFVREGPSVERDFPAEVLKWETCFDAGSDLVGYV
ncbi:MAG: hypothetical protein M1835_007586 [Candelina submexicana]|nr:MAG: hypothetical protein M1835_007586 [Candelina submexicana]